MNWCSSALGRSLLSQCIRQLRDNGDVQNLATVACVLGGSESLISLIQLSSSSLPPPSTLFTLASGAHHNHTLPTVHDIERCMATYADHLRRWSALLQATEVLKHMQSSRHTKSIELGNVNKPLSSSSPSSSSSSSSEEKGDGVLPSGNHKNHHNNNTSMDMSSTVNIHVTCACCKALIPASDHTKSQSNAQSNSQSNAQSNSYCSSHPYLPSNQPSHHENRNGRKVTKQLPTTNKPLNSSKYTPNKNPNSCDIIFQ